MAPTASNGGRSKPKRKRPRKTRTAIVSDVSSSSSSSSSESSTDDDKPTHPASSHTTGKQLVKGGDRMDIDDDSGSGSSSSSSSGSSSSDSSNDSNDDSDISDGASVTSRKSREIHDPKGKRRLQYTPSPERKPRETESSDEEGEAMTLEGECQALMPTPSILRSKLIDDAERVRNEAIARKGTKKKIHSYTGPPSSDQSKTREEDFQAVWMRIVIDEFGEELDALRKKEPTLSSDTGSRMPLLIDALQAGSELFSRGDSSKPLGESDEVGLMLWGKQSTT